MQSITNEINDIIKNNIIYRFENELVDTVDNNKKNIINNILSILQNKTDKIEKNTKTKLDNIFLDLDKKIYSQPWNKIQQNYKENKLIEYIDENYNDNPNKLLIKEFLLNLLETGKLKTIKDIEYDQKEAKIKCIHRMTLDKDNKPVIQKK